MDNWIFFQKNTIFLNTRVERCLINPVLTFCCNRARPRKKKVIFKNIEKREWVDDLL